MGDTSLWLSAQISEAVCSAYYPRLSQVLSFRYAYPENTAISYMRRYLQAHELWARARILDTVANLATHFQKL